MIPIPPRDCSNYGEVLEEAIRWPGEVGRQLEERAKAIAEIGSSVMQSQQDYLAGKQIDELPADVYNTALIRSAGRLASLTSGVELAAVRVQVTMASALEHLKRPLLGDAQYQALHELGYDTRHVKRAELALRGAVKLLPVHIVKFNSRIENFRIKERETTAQLDRAWSDNPMKTDQTPSWVSRLMYGNPTSGWVQPEVDADIPLSVTPEYVASMSSQSIAVYPDSAPKYFTDVLAILLAEKPYPREISESARSFALSVGPPEVSSGGHLSGESVDAPLEMWDSISEVMAGYPHRALPAQAFSDESEEQRVPLRAEGNGMHKLPLTPMTLGLSAANTLCADHQDAVESAIREAEAVTAELYVLQQAFQSDIAKLNAQAPNDDLAQEKGERIREFDEVVESALRSLLNLRMHGKIVDECCRTTQLAKPKASNIVFDDKTKETLEGLRFPIPPIEEFYRLVGQCEENANKFSRYHMHISMVEMNFSVAVESALYALKRARGEVGYLGSWAYSVGMGTDLVAEAMRRLVSTTSENSTKEIRQALAEF